jgi:Intracellular proteinase inhibitor
MRPSEFDPWTEVGVRVESDPDRLESGRPVRWLFTVANRGRRLRVLSFASAQRADVVLVAAGVEHYRWSNGRMFAAVLVRQELAPGEEWSFALPDESLAVPAGRYCVQASVACQPAPPPVRAEVVVHPWPD